VSFDIVLDAFKLCVVHEPRAGRRGNAQSKFHRGRPCRGADIFKNENAYIINLEFLVVDPVTEGGLGGHLL